MAIIKLAYTISGLPPGKVAIITWHKYGSATEIGRRLIDGIANPLAGTFVVEGLQPVAHDFFFYESPDGSTLGAQISSPLRLDASQSVENTVKLFRYKVGRGMAETDGTKPYWEDPADASTFIHDERLEGASKEDVEVEIQGVSPIGEDQYEVGPTGITLSNGPVMYQDNNVVVRWYIKKVVSVAPASVVREERNYVDATGDFTDAMYGKHNFASFAGTRIITTFPNFNTIPDTHAIFSTYRMPDTARYWSLYFPHNLMNFCGSRNWIHLARNERIEIEWKDNIAEVNDYVGDYFRAGKRDFGDFQLPNTFLVNQGHWDTVVPEYNVSDFIRMIEALPGSMRTTYANYDTKSPDDFEIHIPGKVYEYYPNRGKFAIGSGPDEGKFKFPSIGGLSMKFIKALDDMGARFSQGAASIEPNYVLEHGHRIMGGSGDDKARALTGGSGVAGRNANTSFVAWENIIEQTGFQKNIVDNIGQFALYHL